MALRSDAMSAQVDPLGAQLSTLRDRAGQDLMWDGEPTIWAGRCPLLFPIVGELAGGSYRLGSKQYPLARHGFARRSAFKAAQSSAERAVFSLQADDSSLQVYPFRFELEVQFELDGATLEVTSSVRNLGDVTMPASFGYHPGFRWPLPYGQPRESHFIEFTHDEPAPVRRLDSHGLLTAQPYATPVIDRRLTLRDALFVDDVLIFDRVESRSVTYGAPQGPRIQVSYPDAPYLGVWSKPGGGFVCIEPWHGVADPQGYEGDFSAKPGVFSVKPGAAMEIKMALSWLPE